MSALDLVRPDLAGIPNYLASSTKEKIRLHINESPWKPLEAYTLPLNRYPDVEPQLSLEKELSKFYQVAPCELLLTRGADEGIDFLMRLFLSPGRSSMMQFPPTFLMYAFYARLQQASIISCPLEGPDFHFNKERLLELWEPHCKMILLCRPNNPTGNLLSLETIASLCEEFSDRSIIVVDEAYIEFANTQSATTLIHRFENLFVLRTLSKAHGLAGLRLGCVIGSQAMIEAVRTIAPPFAFSSLVLEAALSAMKHPEWVEGTVKNIIHYREELILCLKNFPWVEHVFPSKANFILIKTSFAKPLYAWLEDHHILVRHFASNPVLQDMLRITVGTAAENELLLAVLHSFHTPDHN